MKSPIDSTTPTTSENAARAVGGRPSPDCSLSSVIGFAATKDFRTARRAMTPTVGDTFITRREGTLMFCQVDWVDEEWIGYGRFLAESGAPLGFFKIAQNDWRQSAMGALRIGCEFRPVNKEIGSA